MRLASSIWLTVASLATLGLGASCHLVGGTDGLYIDPTMNGSGGGSSGTGGMGGTGGSSSSSTSTGMGGLPDVCAPEDCPGEDNQCQARACVNEECDIVVEPTGTACSENGGSYCDGAGTCVECLTSEHCGDDPCQDYQCVAASCNDQEQNNGESDVDCGGPCGACGNSLGCFSWEDCQSKHCAGGTCAACTAHHQCPTNDWYCEAAICYPKKDFMDPCTEAYQCLTGLCEWWPIVGKVCSVVGNG